MTRERAFEALEDWEKKDPQRKLELEAAMARNGQLFCPNNIDRLTPRQFAEFLSFAGNQHWHSLQRHPEVYSDMPRLRRALGILLDENQKVQDRLDSLTRADSPDRIKGLREAVLTPILMCAFPCKYAVYNSISTKALKHLGEKLQSGGTLGERYAELNHKCLQLAREMEKPLWLIDVMFSRIVHPHPNVSSLALKTRRAMAP